jgi:predicted nucleic acid-binding protein
MILFDTSVVIDARDASQTNHGWAVRQIEQAVADDGGGINAVIFAELCAGSTNPATIEPDIRRIGLGIYDLPAAVAAVCGMAYRRYVVSRRSAGGGGAPRIPLPDFFIGAHAEVMGWKLATRDHERIRRYYPNVKLVTP